MAYQPIELGRIGYLAGADALSNDLSRAVANYQQQQQQMADNLLRRQNLDLDKQKFASDQSRQGQQDFQSAYLKAQQLAASGDIQGAHALLAPFGAQIQQRQAQDPGEWQSRLNQDEVDYAGDELGDMYQHVKPLGASTGLQSVEPPPLSSDGLSGNYTDPNAYLDTKGAQMGYAADQKPQYGADGKLIPAQQFNANGTPTVAQRLVAAAQADKAKQARMASYLTGRFNGQDYTLDPEAMRAAQLERADKAFAEAGGADGESGDIVREMYPQMRAASIAGNKPLDAEEAMKTIQGEAKLRRATEADAQREAMAQARLEQQSTLADRRLNQSDINNQRMVAAILGAAQARTANQTPLDDKEAAPVNSEISNSIKDFTAKGGLREQLVHSQGALEMLKKNSNNPTAWTNAIDAMIRTNTGRAAIKAQYDLYLSHSAGKTDSLDQMVAALKSAKPSEQQQKNLVGAMEASNAELRAQAKDVYDTYRDYENDPRVKRNPVVREHFIRTEKNTFGRVPGYGQPEGGAPAAQPQGRASAPQALSPADQQLAQRARATQPNDPLYASAQKWLAAHGLK